MVFASARLGNTRALASGLNRWFKLAAMDKLRSLQYFAAAAEEGSFSAAARRLEVTVPAVAKLVAALERELGVALFERSPHGLALTSHGEDYLEWCRPAIERLAHADDQVKATATRPRGSVVVGVQQLVAMNVLVDALPRFRARYPEIQLDLRSVTQATFDDEARAVDVFLSFTWIEIPDMVHRRLGAANFVVAASPEYWAQRGTPRHPSDLERHDCLLIRTQRGAVMDLWGFERGAEKVSVAVKGWMVASNPLRDAVVRLAATGHGVVRLLDWANQEEFRSGRLVPVLTDWRPTDIPPVCLSYWPSRRRVARVRAFIDFAVDLFRELAAQRDAGARVGPPPRWTDYRTGRASAIVSRVKSTS